MSAKGSPTPAGPNDQELLGSLFPPDLAVRRIPDAPSKARPGPASRTAGLVNLPRA
jgi:hypothetical protein